MDDQKSPLTVKDLHTRSSNCFTFEASRSYSCFDLFHWSRGPLNTPDPQHLHPCFWCSKIIRSAQLPCACEYTDNICRSKLL